MEDTPEGDSRQDIHAPKKRRPRLKERPSILRGVPLGLLCRVCDVQEFTGIDRATWQKYEEAGLETFQPGTQATWVFTNDLHELVRSRKIPAPKKRKGVT